MPRPDAWARVDGHAVRSTSARGHDWACARVGFMLKKMRWLVVVGAVIGIALGCGASSRCDEDGECDECRWCVTKRGKACSPAWLACAADPFCDSLVGCVDDCWAGQTPADSVRCEHECRGNTGGVAVVLYDDYRGCIEDACVLSCEW